MRIFFVAICLVFLTPGLASGQVGNYKAIEKNDHGVLFVSDNGVRLKISFYTNEIIRMQWAVAGKEFFQDDRYEIVENHQKKGIYELNEEAKHFDIFIGSDKKLNIRILKSPMIYRIYTQSEEKPVLSESNGTRWKENRITARFEYDSLEHFCGLGHESYGNVESIDLRKKITGNNYGEGKHQHWGPQGVLTVPFYMSGKGYGIFLNSTYQHQFNFGKNNLYSFHIDTKGFEGRMDYFFIYGPHFRDILDRYTQLTGRPRLPQRSVFGLQLSDKGSPKHGGADWWKNKVNEHREAGYPLDHTVNDNRWRAGSGGWSGSWFEWDSTRFPDPESYNRWLQDKGLTTTLDLNRNIIASCEGWKPEYNIPQAEQYVSFGESAPDYTNPEMRNWIWELFWKKSFNPELNYPGDGLWIDETDDMGKISDSVICANGRSWAENENYHSFLIAKAIVGEGWDNSNNNNPPGIGVSKRPYVWLRSMTAGAQRYATYWTGDIYPNYKWMRNTIRAMQVAGLSGFPYFNHDAGGFMNPGPDDNLYINWSMAFGSFTPIWRPHGMGENKRWPLDRSENCQDAAMKYGKLRYELMPWLYTNAYNSHKTGIPMARAMVIDYQENPKAWKYDMQYMWGDELLVAPEYFPDDTILNIWLPGGQQWFNYWTKKQIIGGQVIQHNTQNQDIAVFVKGGSIIPRFEYAQSTFHLDPSRLFLDVYSGKNGSFSLYEDDGITEKYRTQDKKRITTIEYTEDKKNLQIHPAKGTYDGALDKRKYTICFYGLSRVSELYMNDEELQFFTDEEALENAGQGYTWIEDEEVLKIHLEEISVYKKVHLSLTPEK